MIDKSTDWETSRAIDDYRGGGEGRGGGKRKREDPTLRTNNEIVLERLAENVFWQQWQQQVAKEGTDGL